MSNGSTSVTTRSSSPYENDPNSPASRSHLSSNPSLSDSTQSTPATTPGSISFLQKPAQLTREQSFSGQSPASDDFSPTSLIPSHLASQISTQAYAVPPSPPSSHRPRWTPASVTSAVPLVEPYTIQPTPTLPVSQSDPTAHIARSALPQSSLHSSYIEQPQNDSQGATTNLQNALSSPQVVRSPLSNDALGAHAHATVFAEETKSSSKTKTVLKVIRKGAKVVAKGVAKAAGYGIEYTTNIPVNDLAAYLALLFEPNRKSKRQSLRADLQLVLEGALHAPYDDVIKELEKAKKRQKKRSKQSTLMKSVLELARKQQANARQQREQAGQAPPEAPQPASPFSAAQQSSTNSQYTVSPGQSAVTDVSQVPITNSQNVPSSPQHVRNSPASGPPGAHAHATEVEEQTKSPLKKKTVLKVIWKGVKGVAKVAGYGIGCVTTIPVNDLAAYLALLFEPNRKSKRQSLRADLQLVLEGALHAPYDDVIKELEKAKKRQMKRSKQSTLVKGVLELARKQQANARQQREQASQAPQLAPASHIQPVSQRERPINNHVPYDVPDSSMSGIPLSTGQQSSSTSSHYGVSPSPAAETHSAPLSASGAHHHSAQKSRTEGDDVEQELADLGSWMSIDDDGQDGD